MPAKKKASSRTGSRNATTRRTPAKTTALAARTSSAKASKVSKPARAAAKATKARATAKPAQKRTPPAARRVAGARGARAARTPDASQLEDSLLVTDHQIEQESPFEQSTHAPTARQEVAVIGQTSGADTVLIETPVLALDDVHDRYPEDIPIAVVSLILAASPFLAWYEIPRQIGSAVTASGWATGTWGPMIAILGLLSLALAGLRIAGVRVKMPYPDSTIHETVGWVSLVGAVLKFRSLPAVKIGAQKISMDWSWGVLVAAGAALVLAFLAGRMSKGSPFISVPNWFRDSAGKLGAALLALAVVGSVAFATLNRVDVAKLAYGRSDLSQGTQQTGGDVQPNPNLITGKFPECARSFPKPDDAKPINGSESRSCQFSFKSKKDVATLFDFYRSAFDKRGDKYKILDARTALARVFQLTGPNCGILYLSRSGTAQETSVAVATTPCPSGTPGATPTK